MNEWYEKKPTTFKHVSKIEDKFTQQRMFWPYRIKNSKFIIYKVIPVNVIIQILLNFLNVQCSLTYLFSWRKFVTHKVLMIQQYPWHMTVLMIQQYPWSMTIKNQTYIADVFKQIVLQYLIGYDCSVECSVTYAVISFTDLCSDNLQCNLGCGLTDRYTVCLNQVAKLF